MIAFILTCLFLPSSWSAPPIIDVSKLKELDVDWELLSELEIKELNQENDKDKRLKNIELLIKAKQFIIVGDIEAAEFYLNRVQETNKGIEFIKTRYLALIAFISEDYKRSQSLLSPSKYNENKYYKNICVMKIINSLSLNDKRQLYYDLDNCTKITLNYTNNDHFWLNNLYNLEFNRKETFKGSTLSDSLYVLQNQEFTRIWLKSGLYVNKEGLLLNLIKSLPESYYRSKRIRELIGLLYFRTGDQEKAISFIEDIESANSENMKGNYNLRQKKYELAFGHYQLALMKKKNSLNALERSLPLVWKLSQWDKGYDLLDRLIKPDLQERKKITLSSVFKLKQERYKESQKELDILNILFKEQIPLELEQMMTYVGLRLHNVDQYERYSADSCKAMDGVGCWVLMQSLSWENIGKTIDRDDTIQSEKESIDTLKNKVRISKIEEIPSVDQDDIEELDSQLVRITPGVD
ncbi:lipopolysaccharide assembly protein LapB [Halobacteriovorax sp. HLS]|uniref:tetratricopeptide repeat protein n=1 Tax=Halobacteriovorax sp. HLS TaxID=2234000 RepID=UPI000FDC01AD|nr:hypothetical protein [Halobacteriovorax sp. HLS]